MFRLENYRVNDNNYTHQSLNGGKFNIPFSQREELFNYIMKNPECALCERLTEKFPLYIDIDGLEEKLDIEDVINFINKNLLENINEVDIENYLLQNRTKHRNYHIHYPNIIVNKDIAKKFSKLLNKKAKEESSLNYQDNIFDPCAYSTCFRMYGTWKGRDKRNTNYQLLLGEGEETLDEIKIFKLLSLIGYNNNELTSFKNIKENQIQNEIDDTNYDISNKLDTNSYMYKELSKNNWEIGIQLLDFLDKAVYLNNREKWIPTLYCLRYIGFPKKIVMDWSKQYSGHDSNRINQLNHIFNNDVESNKTPDPLNYFIKAAAKNPKFNKITFGLDLTKYGRNYHIYSYDIKTYLEEIKYDETFYPDALLLANLFENKVITIPIKKGMYEIYLWNGDLWEKDVSGYYLINQLTSSFRSILLKCLEHINYNISDEDEKSILSEIIRKKLRMKLSNDSYIRNTIANFIKSSYSNPTFINKFDQIDDILPVKNGNIDLKTGKLLSRKYSDYITRCVDIDYDENIDTSTVDKIIDDTMLNR
jgi:hypothetical protein